MAESVITAEPSLPSYGFSKLRRRLFPTSVQEDECNRALLGSVMKWLYVLTMLVVVAYGLSARIGDQATKGFWVDEAWRAQQILLADSYEELRQGEYFGMEAAVQRSEYLFGKVGLALFGKTELAFRSWIVLWSCTALLLFSLISFRILSPPLAVMASLCFAASPGLIEHAHEFKPYAFETLLGLAFLLVGSYCREQSRVLPILLVLAWIATIFIANVFPFFAFLPFVAVLHDGSRGFLLRIPLWIWAIVGVAVVVAGASYLTYFESLESSRTIAFWKPYMLQNWEQLRFLLFERLPEVVGWYVHPLLGFRGVSLFLSLTAAVLAFIVTPLLLFWHRSLLGWFFVFTLWGPVALSTIGLYPALTRVSTFTFPFFTLATFLALERILDWVPQSFRKQLNLIGLLAVAVFGAWFMSHHLPWENPGRSRHIQEIRPLIRELERVVLPSDVLFANYSSELALRFYGGTELLNLDRGELPYQRRLDSQKIDKLFDEIERTLLKSRVWILCYHIIDGYEPFKAEAKERGLRIITDQQQHRAFLLGLSPARAESAPETK